ncbi:MAG: flagellar FliJ family protein [Oscillospiraceae bacterium]
MKRFEFSLRKMLSYKEQVQGLEKNKLAQLMFKKNQLEDRIETLKQESNRLSKELLKVTQSGISVTEVSNYNFQLQNNRMYLEQLTNELYTASLAVDNQLKVVMIATQEVEGLRKLKEKQYQEYMYEDAKAQELVVSEFVSSKLVREKNNI